ncbi:MAG TPA: hypothetical protein PKU78_06340, partial [Candidatus Dojkabacteria bacterium]|nr:hypothetical protein [Candidatus Dojkabacteria bacterium]
MPKLISEIIGDGLDCAAISRMDIEDIPSFNNILEQRVVPVRMEIAGFDAFVFSREWFLKYEKYLNNDFLIGKPYFDPVIAGLMVAFGGKYKIVNDLPPTAFHIHHGTASVDTACPERDHNQKIFEDNDLYRVVNNIIYNNLQFNLCRRKPWGRFLAPQESESGSQKIFFDMMNIHIPN